MVGVLAVFVSRGLAQKERPHQAAETQTLFILLLGVNSGNIFS